MIRRLKRRLSRSTSSPDRSGPHNWDSDASSVLSTAGMNFAVKYLGSSEVERARGIEVCESVVASFHPPTSKGKKKMILNVSLDGIRVLESPSRAMVFDQPIEKIAFCAPDRFYDRCFSYIARDAAAQKWVCHSFVTILPVTGERISHAVGAAFTQCLQRKQRQDRLRQLQNQAASTSREKSASPPERSSAAPSSKSSLQASIPAQQLQDLYATVHKPSKVPPINEHNPDQEPNLLLNPSAAIPPSLYGPQQPSMNAAREEPPRDPWEALRDSSTASATTAAAAPAPALADPWSVQPPPQQKRPQRRDSAADQWLNRVVRQAASVSPAMTPTEAPGAGAARDPFMPIPVQNDSFQTRDPFTPISTSTTAVAPARSYPPPPSPPNTGASPWLPQGAGQHVTHDHDEWTSISNRHDEMTFM